MNAEVGQASKKQLVMSSNPKHMTMSPDARNMPPNIKRSEMKNLPENNQKKPSTAEMKNTAISTEN